MTQLFALLQDGKNAEVVKGQLASIPEIKRGLDAAERQDLRIDNLAKSARLSDLEDDITAHWRFRIRTNKLAKIHTAVLSDTLGGIINAKRLEKGFDNRILLLIGIIVAFAVTFLWGPAISLWGQTSWGSVSETNQTILIVFMLVAIASAILIVRGKRQKK